MVKKILALIALIVLFTTSASALTPYVSIATQAVGTSYYALGTGIAKIITEKVDGVNATVLPYSGPDEWMIEVPNGTVNLGIISAIDLAWAYKGEAAFETSYSELRLVMSGNWSNHCTMTVLTSSGIKTVDDLRGKRVGYEYGGNKLTVKLVDAALAAAGLTINDCVPVPLADLSSALRALQERRVDVVFSGSSTTPASVQLDEAMGILVLPLGDLTPEDIANGVPKEIQEILDQHVPGATAMVCSAGGTIDVPTVLTSYPIQLCASSKLTEEDMYAITKAIYEHHAELGDVHAWGKEWTPENYIPASFSIPYHEGSVKFYKEVGIWTDAAEATQNALLGK